MGHHLFIHDDQSLPVHDFDVALVRHFLLQGAERCGNRSLATAVAGWKHHGPGVWTGIDETPLVGCGDVFSAAIEAVLELGDWISTGYLNQNAELPGGRWLKEQATSEVVAHLRRLEDFFQERV